MLRFSHCAVPTGHVPSGVKALTDAGFAVMAPDVLGVGELAAAEPLVGLAHALEVAAPDAEAARPDRQRERQ